MKFVLLEDIPDHANWVKENLHNIFPKSQIFHFDTEQQFIKDIGSAINGSESIRLAILDLMVVFSYPKRGETNLGNGSEDIWLAGRRCADLMRDKGYNGPIIFYTCLSEDEYRSKVPQMLRENETFITKSATIKELLHDVKKLISK